MVILNNILSLSLIPLAKTFYFFNIWKIKEDYSVVFIKNKNISSISYSPLLIRMLILAEDRKYLSHCGIDILAIIRAIYFTIMGKTQGASTITQQYVRVLLNAYELSVRRKLKEIMIALLIYNKIDKKEVAQKYLSIAYFGYSMIGVENAAKFLKISLNNMTEFQAAMIVARLKYPQKASNNKTIKSVQRKRTIYIATLYKNYYYKNTIPWYGKHLNNDRVFDAV